VDSVSNSTTSGAGAYFTVPEGATGVVDSVGRYGFDGLPETEFPVQEDRPTRQNAENNETAAERSYVLTAV
jgi:hypothetical protein